MTREGCAVVVLLAGFGMGCTQILEVKDVVPGDGDPDDQLNGCVRSALPDKYKGSWSLTIKEDLCVRASKPTLSNSTLTISFQLGQDPKNLRFGVAIKDGQGIHDPSYGFDAGQPSIPITQMKMNEWPTQSLPFFIEHDPVEILGAVFLE